ncbi:MAG: hypothetical protein RSG59_09540 [Ruthenibacterium sp.]
MQQLSDAWRTELLRPMAGAAAVKVRFFMTDVSAASDVTFAPVAAPEAAWSACRSAAVEDGVPQRPYATFEPGRFLADGSGSVLPDNPAQRLEEGYVSGVLSDGDGVYAVPPGVRLHFAARHTAAALTFTFDAAANDWPAQLRVRAWQGETLLCDTTFAPSAAEFCTGAPIAGFDALEITWLKSAKPFRRARLQQIIFGVMHLFTGRELTKTVQSMEVDPITRQLPKNTLSFTIVNENPLTGKSACLYDPDNPAGVWKFIEQRSPVRIFYGQEITGTNRAEWLNGGRYYLTAQPSVDSLYASFTAQDLLSGLDGEYYRGVFAQGGCTLLQLAQEVLTDAAIPPIYASGVPWRLWDGLAGITTTAPLPVKKHRECLQLLAHAARCVLYTDRAGYIRIEPASDGSTGVCVGLNAMTALPKCTKIATLRGVVCKSYAYAPADTATKLHADTYTVNGTLALHLSYAQATEITASVAGGGIVIAAAACYAAAADITLTGTGTTTLTITGKTLRKSASLITAAVADAPEGAKTELLDNPLITSAQTAAAVAEWVKRYLLLRTTSECKTRGAPELDALDLIRADSRFAAGFPARVLKTKTTYDGGLSGELTLKRMVGE